MAQALRVLLVEDDPADALIVGRYLDRELRNCEVLRTTTLAETLKTIEEQRPQIALLDLGLPDARYSDVLPAVRQACDELVIIVLTGDQQAGTAERVLRGGANDYLPKSELDAPSLRRAIRHAHERVRMRREAQEQADQLARLRKQASDNERLAAVGRIAAGVAHEINNPAAYIMANLETSRIMLGDDVPVDHETLVTLRQCMRESLDGMRRIAAIARDLRTVSRVQDDEVEMVRLDDVVDCACSMLSRHFRKGTRLVRSSDHPPAIPAVRGRLVQVLTNLVANAIQAVADLPLAEREVSIAVHGRADTATIVVTDSGPGIPEALRDRVFEPFFTTKGDAGTGLGLALSAEIAQAHGGSLSLDHDGCRGACITLTLPFDNGLTPARVEPPLRSVIGERPRVLLVDDEPVVRAALARLLSTSCDITTARGGSEALQALAPPNAGFDAVLCDLAMPSMDGPEFFGRAAQVVPDIRDRFVFMTGGAFTERARNFLAEANVRVVSKPASGAELIDAIRQAAMGSQRSHSAA